MNTSHYPDLELCKILIEAVFPKTELCWYEWKNDKYNWKIPVWIDFPRSTESFNEYVCPSIAELLDELPKLILEDRYFLNIEMDYWGTWIIVYQNCYCWDKCFDAIKWENLPNALAEMWLWLKENNYLTK